MASSVGKDLKRAGNRLSRNVSIALRAERIMARRQIAILRRQTLLMAFAGLIAGIGIVMLNVAAFFWLASSLGNPGAGVLIAGVNFVAALAVAYHASRISPENELAPVAEVRDLAMEDIEAEIDRALAEARSLADDLRIMARHPLGTVAPSLVGPALAILLKSLRKKE